MKYKKIVDDMAQYVYVKRLILGPQVKKDNPDEKALGRYLAYVDIDERLQQLRLHE